MTSLKIIAALLAVFLLVSMLPVSIRLFFIQEGTSVRGKIVFRILGVFGYTIQVPARPKKISLNVPQSAIPTSSKMFDFVREFLRINIWLVRHITCKRFVWKTKVGFGDAAATGIGGGLLWSIKGVIFSLLQKNVASLSGETEIVITPVFDQETISTRIDCILKLRVGYIIIACIRLLLLVFIFNIVLKGVRLRERPSN